MENKVLAVVAGYEITEAELDTFLKGLPREQQMYASHPQFRQQCLENLMAIHMFAAEGLETKIDETEEFKKALEAAKRDRICKIAIFDTEDAQINTYMHVKHLNDSFKVSLSGHQWVDIMNPTVNKGEAMRLIQKKYNISYDETMAFGDYLNDYEMMQTCYYSYAMENAHEDLKAICNFNAPSNDEFGVITTIEHFLKK